MTTSSAPAFTRDQALSLLHKYVQNENLRRHMYAVEAVMRAYAVKYGGDPDVWGITGLLHDFDWEIHPTLEDHPIKGQPLLERAGVSGDIRRAIMAHAPFTGIKPETMMEKCMFAVDELCGFIIACALIQPEKKLATVSVDGIKKKLQSKSFAMKVNREDIAQGVTLLGIPEDEHIQTVLSAMQNIHEDIGL